MLKYRGWGVAEKENECASSQNTVKGVCAAPRVIGDGVEVMGYDFSLFPRVRTWRTLICEWRCMYLGQVVKARGINSPLWPLPPTGLA